MADRRLRGITVAVLVTAVAAALSGCATRQPVPTANLAAVWNTQISQALADPNLTAFERAVLSDYQITDAEYQEARDGLRQCMADAGWIVTDSPDGGYVTKGAPGTANEGKALPPEVMLSCEEGTTNYIEPIYLGMRDNPQGLSMAQQVRECFREHGVPDGADLSDDQFAQMINDRDYHASTPQGKLCFYDPTGSQSMTLAQAEAMDSQPRVVVTPEFQTNGPGSGPWVVGGVTVSSTAAS